MKGLVVESAGKICLHDDLPLPEIDEYQVLCRNVGCGICNGTDMQLIRGQMPFIQYPFVLGHEAVGQVVAVGKKSAQLPRGGLYPPLGAARSAGVSQLLGRLLRVRHRGRLRRAACRRRGRGY